MMMPLVSMMPWLAIAMLVAPQSSSIPTTTAFLALRPPSPVVVVVPHRRGMSRRPSWGGGYYDTTVRPRRISSSYIVDSHRHSSLDLAIDGGYDRGIDEGDDNYESDRDRDRSTGEEEEDARLLAMRNILESSWDRSRMGIVPSDPHSAARAIIECVSNAMSRNHNVVTVDLRLPSYDILEGRRAYDAIAVYDLAVSLSDEMRDAGLSRRCLILVRNGGEVNEIERVLESRRRGRKGGGRRSSDDDVLLDGPTTSHRLSSAIGHDLDDHYSPGGSINGPDGFDRIVQATDANARLGVDEDALIVLSPYDDTDVIALRRILARYGSSRTILIVNSRFGVEPREMSDAVLAYGMLPLVAAARGDNSNDDESGRGRGGGGGLRAVVMKRFPRDWTVYVDVHGDGFVEAEGGGGGGGGGGGSERGFPSPEWIARRVQSHVEGLSRRRDTLRE
jgi:hypothetical protein